MLPYKNFLSLLILAAVNTPLTAVSPHEPVSREKISTCKLSLKTCPSDANTARTREFCMNNYSGCPDGTSYICGTDASFIIEQCAPEKECIPGTTHTFTADPKTKNVSINCLPCLDGFFETEYTRLGLSSTLKGCTYVHLPQDRISPNLVLFREGTKSSPAVYQCDAENGYGEDHGYEYCDDTPSTACKCVNLTCPPGKQLRPDGSCIRCPTTISRKTAFLCEMRMKNEDFLRNFTTPFTISSGYQEDSIPTEPKRETSRPQTTISVAGESEKAETTKWLHIILGLLGSIIVLIILVVMVALIVIYCRSKRKKAGTPQESLQHNRSESQQAEQSNINNESSIINVTYGHKVACRDCTVFIGKSPSSHEAASGEPLCNESSFENLRIDHVIEELKPLIEELRSIEEDDVTVPKQIKE